MTADCRKHKKRCGRDGIRIMDNGNKKTKVLIIDDDPYISEMYLLKFKIMNLFFSLEHLEKEKLLF